MMKILAGTRWAHKHQVLAVPACISCRDKDGRLHVESPAAAVPYRKHTKELKVPRSPDCLSRLECVHQCMQLNLGKIRYIGQINKIQNIIRRFRYV
jgi:hypothetical protein